MTDARLVAVGGTSAGQVLKSVAALDLATATWTDLPDMGTARHGLAVAAVGKTVYAIGGSTGAGDGQITSSAEALKLAPRKPQPASEWRSLPDAPTPRLMMASTVLDGKIWVAGGMRHGETLQTVESYDPERERGNRSLRCQFPCITRLRRPIAVRWWSSGAPATTSQTRRTRFSRSATVSGTELPTLQHARAAAAAAVVDDKLVVVGGQDDKQLVAQTEVFDGESWTQAADVPTPREHLAAVSDGVYVYTVGGRFLSADENSAAFERFDPESGKWDKLVDMPTPRGSYGAAFIDGRIVAVGGEEPTRVLATVEMYDIANRKVDHPSADRNSPSRPGGSCGRLGRLLHRGRRPAFT